ncbi:hypothetical protein N431DRAFT_452846 [Stipitochalara longipes BDJ]|nr:hypothetical protein N431DRAFT_452846 [Stipitochalara longipes BDJ]
MGHTWTPSAHTSIKVGKSQVASILSLKGFEITSIAFVERGFEVGNSPLQGNSDLFQRVLQHCRMDTFQYRGDDLLKEAMECTLTASKSKEGYMTSENESETSRGFDVDVLKGYTFFITTNGHMGIGSTKLQVGDSVYALMGGEVLFILRSNGDYYRLVGECYVHGLMNGEAMAMLNTGEAQEKWFDLH